MFFFYYFEKTKDSKHVFATSLPIVKFVNICTAQIFDMFTYMYICLYFNNIIYLDFIYIYIYIYNMLCIYIYIYKLYIYIYIYIYIFDLFIWVMYYCIIYICRERERKRARERERERERLIIWWSHFKQLNFVFVKTNINLNG